MFPILIRSADTAAGSVHNGLLMSVLQCLLFWLHWEKLGSGLCWDEELEKNLLERRFRLFLGLTTQAYFVKFNLFC